MRRAASLGVAFVTICLLAGCAATMGGPKPGDTYSAPHGNFDVPVPSMGMFGGGTYVEPQSDEFGGRVSFSDDTGALQAITYLVLPETSGEVMADVERRQAAIRGFLHDYAMTNLFQQEVTGAEVVHEEDIGSGMDMEYFAVVQIPEGSASIDVASGKRLDSTRSVLIFLEGGCMYMLEYDAGVLTSEGMEGNSEYTLPVLSDFRSTIVFK